MNSSELKGFLTGLIIGDGYIDSGITARSFRIKSIHEDYIRYIENELRSSTNFNISVKHFDQCVRDGVNHKEYWELTIKSHPYFAKKYHHFYDDNRHRIISPLAMQWLNERGLANWYMSDGYVCLVGKESNNIYNRRIELCTDRYNKRTIMRLQNMLYKKFYIESSIIKRGNRYRLRIRTNSYCQFIRLILPYMVPSMLYKLYLGYDMQPMWMPDDIWELQLRLRSAMTLAGNAEGHDIV